MEIIQYTNSNISQDNLQNFSQSNQDVTSFGFVSYDKDTYKVIGEYSNELYLFRAKKLWKTVLQDTFLLEEVTDFKFQVRKNSKLNVFTLSCTFKSACGRYAFWRINNNQNPEVTYILEAAHLTQTTDNYDQLLNRTPNFIVSHNSEILCDIEDKANNISEILKKIVKKICKIKDEEEE